MSAASSIDRPPFSEKQAQTFAKDYYGITATARSLDSYIDQNFLLRALGGERFILKVANAAERGAVLDLQHQALKRLGEPSPVVQVPRVVLSKEGEEIVAVADERGTVYLLRLLTYLPGAFLADIKPQSPALLHGLGKALGSLDMVLLDFYHPAAERDLPWDLKNALRAAEDLHFIVEPARRRLVEYFLLQFEESVLPFWSRLRHSVIHNDANDHNVLVNTDIENAPRISGLIDFGDMVRTATVCEPAIAATYAMFGKADPLEAAAQVIAGYQQTFPLLDDELEMLFYLIAARLCFSVVMSARHCTQEPQNVYLAVSQQPAWALLEHLLETNPWRAQNRFREACGRSPRWLGLTKEENLQRRRRHVSSALSVSYRRPLKIVRGALQYLFDADGRTYLDCVNNVCHIGHCHPGVVKAARQQMAVLNTNTRYLYDPLVEYAERLGATLPDPLEVCFLVNSGSEANDLALRLAQTYTGRRDCIVVEVAYHGHTRSVIELSPYKFDGPGGSGRADHIQSAPLPDGYRGRYNSNDPQAGTRYAEQVRGALKRIELRGRGVAGFFCESLLSCAGQIELPPGYLEEAYRHVRAAGGVCVADEVQVGFGRVGSHFWGFETQGVVPDIVTLGKPIGNGHPLAAVITTSEIAAAFANGMEYFNTFGGNPVSCRVGLAVLAAISEEGLQEQAARVGGYLKAGLTDLQSRHQLVGDVRGRGLFLGVELVLDRQELTPAPRQAARIVEKLKERGILLSIDGPLHNVLKIKPPLVFTKRDAERLLTELEEVLKGMGT